MITDISQFILGEVMIVNNEPDPKIEFLREQGVLNHYPEKVSDPLFSQGDFFDARDLAQVKYEMVRRVRTDGSTVSRASLNFGLSRPSFYQAQSALAREGLPGLFPKKRGPRGKHKLTPEVLRFIQQTSAKEDSVHAQALKAVRQVEEQFRITLHPRTIERALSGFKKKRPQAS
jgi:transposase-like protein